MKCNLSLIIPAVAVALLAGPASSQDRALPHTQAAFAVGDTVPANLELSNGFPGLDLPTLTGKRCYVRTDEFVYTIDEDTREVIEVHAIGDVLIW